MEMLSDLEELKRGPEMDIIDENIGISPNLLLNQKRAPGMEFVGKRSGGLWNDRMGFGKGRILKRAPGMEFVGKRASWMEFMRKASPLVEPARKRGPVMKFVGKRSSNSNNLADNAEHNIYEF